MTDLCSRVAPVRVLATASSCDPTSIPPLLALFSAPDAYRQLRILSKAFAQVYRRHALRQASAQLHVHSAMVSRKLLALTGIGCRHLAYGFLKASQTSRGWKTCCPHARGEHVYFSGVCMTFVQ